MKTIANAFLIVFLNAAGLGIADTLLNQQLGMPALGGLSRFSSALAVLIGLVLYLNFAFNRHLPKLVLVPPLIFLFWGMLDYWPLEILGGDNYRLYAAIVQLLIGLLALRINRQLNGKSRLLVTSQFTGPAFCGRNLWRFSLINIPLLPVAVLLLSFSTASNLIDEYSAGFMRLKPNGLYMVEKNYQRQNKTIRLTSMIHLGQQDYYRAMSASIEGQPLLVLAEGVSDEDSRLQSLFSYNKIADLLGLASQELMDFPGRLVTAESLQQLSDIKTGSADILPADIDLREFDPRTIEVLNALGQYLLNSSSLTAGYNEFSQWAQQHMPEETQQVVMNDLVQKRNKKVLSYLPQALQKYDTILIPWGALHMPGIEQVVLAKGFTLQESHERLSIDFLLLPYERLWGSIGATE